MVRQAILFTLLLVMAAPVGAVGLDDRAYHEQLVDRVEQRREALQHQPTDASATRSLGAALYYLGVAADDDDALKEAERLFEQLHASDPDSAIDAAYLGSLLLQKARRVWAPWKKGELSKQGVTLLNAAVELAPEDPHVRFVRAATTYHLPKEFKLAEQTRADFAWLARDAEAFAAEGALRPDLAAAALVRHAKLTGDLAPARRALALAPDSHAAWQAHHLLNP